MRIFLSWSAVALLVTAMSVQAAGSGGITVGGTRLIYDGGKKEASLSVSNSDSGPYLIQSWAEPLSGTAGAPFLVTPPLFRLDGGQQSTLRVIHNGEVLPDDRESMFWLNVKSIPSGTQEGNGNVLQIAVKTRIKLIFRPKGLKGTPLSEAGRLTWRQQGNRLTVTNPTPFYMNFSSVSVGGREVKDASWVAPNSSTTLTAPSGTQGTVSWKIITDYGGSGELHTAPR